MKKFVMLFLASTAFAAPVGNPVSPCLVKTGFFIPSSSWVNVRAGYEGDFVTDGRMIQQMEGSGRVDSFKQYTNSGTLTLNFVDQVDLFGVFGASSVKADWRFNNPETENNHRAVLKTHDFFLWALGARAIFYEWRRLYIGAGGRYTFSDYHPYELEVDGIDIPVAGTQLRWEQWQINADFSYNIHYFTPYIGVKYSNAKAHLGTFPDPIANDGTGSNEFVGRIPVGLYLGCGITNGKYFLFNIEGRLIDEEAVTLTGEFRF